MAGANYRVLDKTGKRERNVTRPSPPPLPPREKSKGKRDGTVASFDVYVQNLAPLSINLVNRTSPCLYLFLLSQKRQRESKHFPISVKQISRTSFVEGRSNIHVAAPYYPPRGNRGRKNVSKSKKGSGERKEVSLWKREWSGISGRRGLETDERRKNAGWNFAFNQGSNEARPEE